VINSTQIDLDMCNKNLGEKIRRNKGLEELQITDENNQNN